MNVDHHDCPHCQSPNTYPKHVTWSCADCYYEWSPEQSAEVNHLECEKFLDINGVKLADLDCVRLSKDLKVGGKILKSGTKIKSIRLLEEPKDGHEIFCKIEGIGAVYLKCSVVRKV